MENRRKMSADDRQAVLVAENEAAFREANEGLRAAFERHGNEERMSPLPFLCECGDRACTTVIRVPPDVYVQVREQPARFLIAPGHKQPDEQLIEETESFEIIDKTGTAGEVARKRWFAHR